MKGIEPNGGPFLPLSLKEIAQWGGIDELKFLKSHLSAETDYDAICDISNDRRYNVIGLVCGGQQSTIFLSMPFPTLIVDATEHHVYLAQIETSEHGWSDAELSASAFETPTDWSDAISVDFEAGTIILFDSACVLSDLRESEVLSAQIEGGRYISEWSSQFCEGKAEMYFIRLVRDR